MTVTHQTRVDILHQLAAISEGNSGYGESREQGIHHDEEKKCRILWEIGGPI